MFRNIMITIFAVILVGCGSTSKSTKTPEVQTNKGVEKLVKYSILEPELANMMALKAAQNKLDNRNASKNSALSALTGDGVLVEGYLLSSVLGAGFSLGDFLSPTNIILSGLTVKKEWKKHETNVIFIEVPLDCDEECAIERLTTIAVKQKQLQYEMLNQPFPDDLTVHHWTAGMWSKKSHKYNLNDNNGNMIMLFSLRNPEFFEIDGKRYYGGNPENNDPTDSRWSFGDFKEDVDAGLFALIQVSAEHPELFSYFPKDYFKRSKFGEAKQQGCRGNFIVQDGKVELIYQMFGCLAFADEKNAPPESLIVYQ